MALVFVALVKSSTCGLQNVKVLVYGIGLCSCSSAIIVCERNGLWVWPGLNMKISS
jgi:hypothetical protein